MGGREYFDYLLKNVWLAWICHCLYRTSRWVESHELNHVLTEKCETRRSWFCYRMDFFLPRACSLRCLQAVVCRVQSKYLTCRADDCFIGGCVISYHAAVRVIFAVVIITVVYFSP